MKNAIFFRHSAQSASGLAAIPDLLVARPFVPCAATQRSSHGWVAPRAEGGSIGEVVGGILVLEFKIETKKLDAGQVRQLIDERCKLIEAECGRKPGRKAKADLKEEVELSLLPTAPTKSRSIRVLMQPDGLMAADVATLGKADEMLTSMVQAIPEFRVISVRTLASPSATMAAWLNEGATTDGFIVGRHLGLKSEADSTQAAIKFKNCSLDTDEVKQYIRRGFCVQSMAVGLPKASFTLIDSGAIKGVLMEGEVATATKEEKADAFDADITLSAGTLFGDVFPALMSALGGEEPMTVL